MGDQFTWDTETDWQNAQERSNIAVEGGSFGLATAIPDSGVSRWKFDNANTENGTALDSWGSNDATINGVTTEQTGLAGYDSGESYSFDGSDDYVDAPNSAPDPCTISVWVQPNDFNATYVVYSTRNTTNSGLLIRIETDGTVVGYVGNGGGFDSVSGGSISTSSPTHAIMAVDDTSNEMEFYVDGSSAGTTSISRSFGGTINIGRSEHQGYHLNGFADDPRLYDKRLSDSEALNLYNTGIIN